MAPKSRAIFVDADRHIDCQCGQQEILGDFSSNPGSTILNSRVISAYPVGSPAGTLSR
jgi:hypothetical protein